MAIFVLSLQSIRWSFIKWHCFANHPALPRVILASKSRTCGSHLPSTTCKICGNGSQRGGGVARVALWRLSTKQGNIVFWQFLQSYMTSRHSSFWYLLLFEQRIFLYYLGFSVMAILCSAAKNSLRSTTIHLIRMSVQWLTRWLVHYFNI
jgi:hypothetical protein